MYHLRSREDILLPYPALPLCDCYDIYSSRDYRSLSSYMSVSDFFNTVPIVISFQEIYSYLKELLKRNASVPINQCFHAKTKLAFMLR